MLQLGKHTARAARAWDASALSASSAAAAARCRFTSACSPLFCFCSVASIACRQQPRSHRE
jgi:hypothetical protein